MSLQYELTAYNFKTRLSLNRFIVTADNVLIAAQVSAEAQKLCTFGVKRFSTLQFSAKCTL